MINHSQTRLNRYQQVTTPPKPAPAATLPRRRSSLTKMVNDAQDWFARGPIIGPTRPNRQYEDAEDLRFDFSSNDKFEKVEDLAEGNEAQVSVMKAASTGKLFVVKHTKPVLLRRPEDKEYLDSEHRKYPNEARTAIRTLMPYKYIVQIFSVEPNPATPGRFFLWQEYCSGGDLYRQIQHWYTRKRSPVPEQFVLHVAVSIIIALAFIHHGLRSRDHGRYTQDDYHHGVIHGDLKPENIFLRWTDKPLGGMPEVVIGDFGVARRVDNFNAKVDAGTPKYHGPEDVAIHQNAQAIPKNKDLHLQVVNSRTTAMDMYAAGQIIYQTAARENEPREIGLDPTDLNISRDYDTLGLRELIVKCLTVDKNDRAAASFDERVGILPDTYKLRTARDAMVQRCMALDRTEWNQPKPK